MMLMTLMMTMMMMTMMRVVMMMLMMMVMKQWHCNHSNSIAVIRVVKSTEHNNVNLVIAQ